MKNRMKNRMLLLMGMIFMGGSAYGDYYESVYVSGSGGSVSYVETYLSRAVFVTAMNTQVGINALRALVEFSETPAGKTAMNTLAGKNTINAFFQLLVGATPTTLITQESLNTAMSNIKLLVGNSETEDSVASAASGFFR